MTELSPFDLWLEWIRRIYAVDWGWYSNYRRRYPLDTQHYNCIQDKLNEGWKPNANYN